MNPLTRLLDNTHISLRAVNSLTPKGAYSLFGNGLTAAGKMVTKSNATGLTSIYHAIDLISQDYASLPQAVYESTGKGREKRDDNEISVLINTRPNYFQTPFEFKRMRAVHRLVYGNSYVLIYRNKTSGRIEQLVPIHPDKVSDIWESDGELWYRVEGIDMAVPSSELLHVKDLTIGTGFKGTSRIDACKEAIASGLAINEYAATYFGNGANAGTTIESEVGSMDLSENPEQRKSLEISLDKKFKGSANAWKSLVLPPGFKLSNSTSRYNQQQSQFIESRIKFDEEVAQIFNLPLNKMRVKRDGQSYNSQEQSNIEYVTDCLVPFSQGFKEEDNYKLFKSNELGKIKIRVQFEGRLKGDMKTQGEFIDKMVGNGIYSTNQALEFLGLDPIGTDGDIRYKQGNLMFLGQSMIDNNSKNGEAGN